MWIRRLQKSKRGSFTISVPKVWVDKSGLKAGDLIKILEEEDSSLRLFSMSFERQRTVTLRLEEGFDLRALEYLVRTCYMQGSDKISIVSKKQIPTEKQKKIKLFSIELPGTRVTRATTTRLIFEVLFQPKRSLESLIEITSGLSTQIHKDAIDSLLRNDVDLAETILETGKEALRFYRMTIRQVSLSTLSNYLSKKEGIRECQERVVFAFTARDINRLVYHSTSIAKQVTTSRGKKVDIEILNLISEMSTVALKMQNEAVIAFLNKDWKLAITVMDEMGKVRDLEERLMRKAIATTKNMEMILSIQVIARALRRIAGHSVAIADNAMNRVRALVLSLGPIRT